jgi:hypothetical protein
MMAGELLSRYHGGGYHHGGGGGILHTLGHGALWAAIGALVRGGGPGLQVGVVVVGLVVAGALALRRSRRGN